MIEIYQANEQLFDATAAILAIVSIGFAILSFQHSMKLEREFKKEYENFEKAKRSISE